MSARSNSSGRGRLHFLIGLPQSGKSIAANEWLRGDKLPPRGDGLDCFEMFTYEKPRVIVCGDDFRHALYGREFQIEAEASVFAMMDVAARALLSRGHDVMMDETCTTEATLLRYLRIDREAVLHVVWTCEETCIERAIAAGRDYLVGPIKRMAKQMNALLKDYKSVEDRLKAYLVERDKCDIPV